MLIKEHSMLGQCSSMHLQNRKEMSLMPSRKHGRPDAQQRLLIPHYSETREMLRSFFTTKAARVTLIECLK